MVRPAVPLNRASPLTNMRTVMLPGLHVQSPYQQTEMPVVPQVLGVVTALGAKTAKHLAPCPPTVSAPEADSCRGGSEGAHALLLGALGSGWQPPPLPGAGPCLSGLHLHLVQDGDTGWAPDTCVSPCVSTHDLFPQFSCTPHGRTDGRPTQSEHRGLSSGCSATGYSECAVQVAGT